MESDDSTSSHARTIVTSTRIAETSVTHQTLQERLFSAIPLNYALQDGEARLGRRTIPG